MSKSEDQKPSDVPGEVGLVAEKATFALVIVNVAVFVAMIGSTSITPESLVAWGANFGPKTMDGQWWRLATQLFLHRGLLHLVGNMLVLWYVGRRVEGLVGRLSFALLYVLSGLVGGMVTLAWRPHLVAVGASGALFGVMGAFLALATLRRDALPMLRELSIVIIALTALNVSIGMQTETVNLASHAGGLVGGFLCGLVLGQPLRFRNAVLVAAGAIALPLAALALPETPPDIQGEVERFLELDKQIMAVHESLVNQLRVGTITQAGFADRLERDILPPWIGARRRIEGLLAQPHANVERLSRLAEHVKCKEEAWLLQVKGMRDSDLGNLEQAKARWEAGEKIRQEIWGQ